MRTWRGRNFMPDDRPGVSRVTKAWLIEGKALNALGIEMNLAMLFARKAFQQFGKRALRAMPAVNEGGDDGDAQVSASGYCTFGEAARRRRTGQIQQESASGTECQGAAKNKRSKQNLRTAGFR